MRMLVGLRRDTVDMHLKHSASTCSAPRFVLLPKACAVGQSSPQHMQREHAWSAAMSADKVCISSRMVLGTAFAEYCIDEMQVPHVSMYDNFICMYDNFTCIC